MQCSRKTGNTFLTLRPSALTLCTNSCNFGSVNLNATSNCLSQIHAKTPLSRLLGTRLDRHNHRFDTAPIQQNVCYSEARERVPAQTVYSACLILTHIDQRKISNPDLSTLSSGTRTPKTAPYHCSSSHCAPADAGLRSNC